MRVQLEGIPGDTIYMYVSMFAFYYQDCFIELLLLLVTFVISLVGNIKSILVKKLSINILQPKINKLLKYYVRNKKRYNEDGCKACCIMKMKRKIMCAGSRVARVDFE